MARRTISRFVLDYLRKTKNMNLPKPVLIGLGAVVVAGLAWWLISPLFINKLVDEELPMRTKTAINALSKKVEEVDKGEFINQMNEMAAKDENMGYPMPHAEEGIEVLATGSVRPVAHDGSGTLKLLNLLPHGDQIIRIEDLDVLNGPNLHVYLSSEYNVESHDDLGDFIDLGELKGNKGNQNYLIPDNVDATKFKSIVIYCVPFRVVFASANIELMPQAQNEGETSLQEVSKESLVGGWNVQDSGSVGWASIMFDESGAYDTHLNERPFDDGEWKLENGNLTLSSSVADLSAVFSNITLKDSMLSLESQGKTTILTRVE